MTTFAFYAVLVFFIVLCFFFALLILIQKGRGGGISAAFGGAGGNTAFGSKTGDVLTWATAIVFGIFLTSAVALNLLAHDVNKKFVEGETAVVAPGGAAAVAAPGSPTTTPSSTSDTLPPTSRPMGVVPVQNRNPQGITEPAVANPTAAPSDQPSPAAGPTTVPVNP